MNSLVETVYLETCVIFVPHEIRDFNSTIEMNINFIMISINVKVSIKKKRRRKKDEKE